MAFTSLEPVALEGDWHVHSHEDHEHKHAHPYLHGGGHVHGWHGNCKAGDDTFGEEPGPKAPSGKVAPQLEGLTGPLIVTPYVPGMLQAKPEGEGWVTVDVSASQYDYWDLMCRLLERWEPFLIVEQDMLPTPEQVEEVWLCNEPACAISYNTYRGDVVKVYGDYGALGFTLLRGKTLMTAILRQLQELGPVTWSRLDGHVYRALRVAGHRYHVHPGSVTHRHEYPMAEESRPAGCGRCQWEDYAGLSIVWPWKGWLQAELDEWHHTYRVPEGGTVLDVGAGCGESVRYYLLHGAAHVVAVEGDPVALQHLMANYGSDPRVTVVAAQLDQVKIDIEGAEEHMDLETHFPAHWDALRVAGEIVQWRLVRD